MLGRAAGKHIEKAEDDYQRKYYSPLNTAIAFIE